MKLLPRRLSFFLFLLLRTAVVVQAQEGEIPPSVPREQLLEWQQSVVDFDWEWILIRFNQAFGLENADWFLNQADTIGTVRAIEAILPTDVVFQEPMDEDSYNLIPNDNNPEWFGTPMIAYQAGSVSEVEVVLQDDDSWLFGSSITDLIRARVSVPETFDEWTDYEVEQGPYRLSFSLRRSVTPLDTPADHEAMGLTERVFDLTDTDAKAVLVYSLQPSNTKAVLYFPGVQDSFAHPNVLEFYQSRGYDVYALDARLCGRARRFMDDPQFGHDIDDFDRYREEIDLTLEFIRTQKSYTTLLAHTHSVGITIALNYVLQVGEDPFDGYVLNGPFLAFSFFTPLETLALKNPSFFVSGPFASESRGISVFTSLLWILSRFGVEDKPLIEVHVTVQWIEAAVRVFDRIRERRGNLFQSTRPITERPVLQLHARGDTVVEAADVEDILPLVSFDVTQVLLDFQNHDVTASTTRELNQEALDELGVWLDNNSDVFV